MDDKKKLGFIFYENGSSEKSLTVNLTGPWNGNYVSKNCAATCIQLNIPSLLSVFSKTIFMSHPSRLFGMSCYKATPHKTWHVAMTKCDTCLTYKDWITDLLLPLLTFNKKIFIVVVLHTNTRMTLLKHIQEFTFYSFYILILLLEWINGKECLTWWWWCR